MGEVGRPIRRVSSREVYRNRWVSLREDRIEYPDGSPGLYSVLDRPDFALIVPADGERLCLVEQYRYPVGGRFWEFPQGGVEGGSVTGPDLARAELREETGYRAGALVHLGRLFGAHGITGQAFDAYLATDLVPGEPEREPEEQGMVEAWFSRTEVEAMIRDGRMRDDASVAAYLLLLLHERGSDT